jgi:GntR family transcriptional regulator, transcriptional repressor for pyruvate dehydrogenase complex
VAADTGVAADTVEAALTHVAQRRAHEYVAEQIRRVVVLRVVAPGSRLPYEQELAAALGVSRATVTQALRQLEREGLVEVRRGRGGGVFVQEATTDGADPVVLAELRATAATIRHAAGLRAIVEPAVAALAAERAGDDALERLAGHNAAMQTAAEDDYRFMRADTSFHLALARASGNPLLVEAVERSRLAMARALEVLPDSPAWHDRTVTQHAALLDALRAHDAAAARRAMARHVRDTGRALNLMLTTLGT